MVTVAKMTDGKIVEIVRVAETVGFSTERQWILICYDFEKMDRRRDQFKWVKMTEASFIWIRVYESA